MAAILVFTTFTSSTFAHVSDQQRFNDRYNAGQNYAACDYNNCDERLMVMTQVAQMIKSTPMNSVKGIHLVIRLSGIH